MGQVVGRNNPDKWVLQLDLINAFNLANRDEAFKEVEKSFPDCLKWILTCYGAESHLIFGDTVIPSSVGFHQGDPLAGLLFCCNLQPVVECIEDEVPDLDLNAWLYDDGTVVGTKEELQQVVDILTREGPPRVSISPPLQLFLHHLNLSLQYGALVVLLMIMILFFVASPRSRMTELPSLGHL